MAKIADRKEYYNLHVYDAVREVPKEAKKTIGGGRLKGMTDINPMWRLKTLTEQFGVCGFGWYYDIVDQWVETSMSKDEMTANVKINLYVKMGDEWSKPIAGIGGSMLVAKEKNGLYVNDECYKMALTDAISVACKALGMGADVYWDKDNTKYNDEKKENVAYSAEERREDIPATENQIKILDGWFKGKDEQVQYLKDNFNVLSVHALTVEQASQLIGLIKKKGA